MHAHAKHALDAAGSDRCVQGRQYQVAAVGRTDRNLRGFRVANLADHDDIGVLSQDRSKSIGKRQLDFRIDLHLADAVELIFDRILNRDDVFLG
jgi:hypothetical protein